MDFKDIPINKTLSENHTLAVLSLSAVIAIILILRCFNAVFYPILFNEDGTQIVAYFLNNPHPSEIFRFYEGYISLIPNLVGFLTTHYLPLHFVPYVLVTISLVFAVAALSLFSLRRFAFIMPDDRSRMIVCLMLALFPLGNQALITNMTFSIWNIFTISLLVILSPLPRSHWMKAAQFCFLALAIFSHPYSVLFIPLCLALLFLRPSRPDRIANAGIIVLAVLYFFLGINKTVVGPQVNLATILASLECLVHRIVFEPFFGNNLRVLLQQASRQIEIILLALGIVAGFVAVVINNSRTTSLKNKLPMFGMLLFVIVSLTYISVSSRLGKYDSFVTLAWAQRYFFTQQMIFVFLVLLYVVGLVKPRNLVPGARVALLALIVCYFSYLNVHHANFFKTSKKHSISTIKFLRDVDAQLNSGQRGVEHDGGNTRQIVLDRNGWDIKINLPAKSGQEE